MRASVERTAITNKDVVTSMRCGLQRSVVDYVETVSVQRCSKRVQRSGGPMSRSTRINAAMSPDGTSATHSERGQQRARCFRPRSGTRGGGGL